MDDSSSNDSALESYLISSLADLTNILKAVSQPSRLQILIHSLTTPRSFKDLLEFTTIQKTALNVHINQLIDQKLLSRSERGIYRTTMLGEELIRVSALVLKDSRFKNMLEEGSPVHNYHTFGELTMKKLISDDIKYQPAWLSYIASVTGVMKYYNLNVSLEDVAGYSGYAFLLNMRNDFSCPSGPTAHPDSIWEEMHKGTEQLGVTITHWFENESFPETEFAVSSRDQKRSKVLFEKAKSIIDVSNRPVIIWGIPVPEYGIVKGYDGDSYLVSTFRHLHDVPDTPIKYDKLQAPGCMELLTLEPNQQEMTDEYEAIALQRAYKFATGKYKAHDGYSIGIDALDVWISHLGHEDEKYHPYYGNSYLGICTQEAYELAEKFLLKKSVSLQNNYLEKAGKDYGLAYKNMGEFTTIFPEQFKGEMPEEKRKQGIAILRTVKENVSSAITNLEQAVK